MVISMIGRSISVNKNHANDGGFLSFLADGLLLAAMADKVSATV